MEPPAEQDLQTFPKKTIEPAIRSMGNGDIIVRLVPPQYPPGEAEPRPGRHALAPAVVIL